MAGTTSDVGTGTTVVFGTSGFTSLITNVSWSGISREALDTSNMATAAPTGDNFANMTYIPSALADPGTLELELLFDPDQAPPIDAVTETITVSYPLVVGDSTPSKWECSGFVTDFSSDAPHDGVMTASMSVKLTGNIDPTAAA